MGVLEMFHLRRVAGVAKAHSPKDSSCMANGRSSRVESLARWHSGAVTLKDLENTKRKKSLGDFYIKNSLRFKNRNNEHGHCYRGLPESPVTTAGCLKKKRRYKKKQL